MMGANGFARLTLLVSFLNATGANQNLPKFRVILSNVLLALDTGSIGAGGGVNSIGTYFGWKAIIEIRESGVNQQYVSLQIIGTHGGSGLLNAAVTSGAGAWQTLGQFWFVQCQAAGLNANAAADIPVTFTTTNFVANANYQTVLDYTIL